MKSIVNPDRASTGAAFRLTSPIPATVIGVFLCVMLAGCGTVGSVPLSKRGQCYADADWATIWPSGKHLQAGKSLHLTPLKDAIYDVNEGQSLVIPFRVEVMDPSFTNQHLWVYSSYSIDVGYKTPEPLTAPPSLAAIATPWPPENGGTCEVEGGGIWERRAMTMTNHVTDYVVELNAQMQHAKSSNQGQGFIEIGHCFIYLTDGCKYRPASILSNILTVRFIHWK